MALGISFGKAHIFASVITMCLNITSVTNLSIYDHWPVSHICWYMTRVRKLECIVAAFCLFCMSHEGWYVRGVTYISSVTNMSTYNECHIYVDMWPESENLKALVLPFAGAASLFFPYTGCHSGRPCDCKVWKEKLFLRVEFINIATGKTSQVTTSFNY